MDKNRFRIGVLALAHLVADFYFGLAIPLPEPTLVRHLSVDLLGVMLILSAAAIVVNAIQPVAGAFLPKKGLPWLLAVTPLLATGISWIGLTRSYWAAALLFLTTACGVGLFHNEAVLTLQGLTRLRHGLSIAVFMSGGYFGVASGALVAGWWAQTFGLEKFWVWAFPGVALTLLVVGSGLHRFEPPAVESTGPEDRGGTSFGLVFGLSACVATANVIVMRLLPVYLVRAFGPTAQVWSGAVFFAIGLAGALAAYAWGSLSHRFGYGRLVVAAWVLGTPFLYLLLHPGAPEMVVVWGPVFGFTIGGVFPLTVVLARSARGLSQRLRLGFVIGGSWGLGEVAAILLSKYIDRFGPTAVEPVATGLNLCWILVCATVLLGSAVARNEARNRSRPWGRPLAAGAGANRPSGSQLGAGR